MPTLDDYSAARADFVRQSAVIDRLAAEIEAVGNALKSNRSHFMFSNAGGLPGAGGLSPRMATADANNWKSGNEINAELSKWHNKRDALASIWEQLTPDQRSSLQPPPRDVAR